jgi:hypothetical protein
MLPLVLSLWFVFSLNILVDAGAGIDPIGGARATSCADEGSGLDPHGRPCTQQMNIDDGSGLDPHG